MRVVFLGTPTFAVPSFKKLLEHSYEICCVFTQPDRPSGRGQKLHLSPIKTVAADYGIPVLQPDRISSEQNRDYCLKLQTDFIVVVAYGQILPEWLLQSARLMAINVHASLLPKYRGASPIATSILNGDTITGVTTMMMEGKLDAGPVLLQQTVAISPTITAGELTTDLSMMGGDLLIKTMDGIRNNTIRPLSQDESRASYAPRITKERAAIAWEKNSTEIHNQIRAMNPWPVATTLFHGDPLFIWRSLPENPTIDSPKSAGSFLGFSGSGIRIQCGEGTTLDVLEVQRPGKSHISGRDFANGAHLRAGERVFS